MLCNIKFVHFMIEKKEEKKRKILFVLFISFLSAYISVLLIHVLDVYTGNAFFYLQLKEAKILKQM